MFACRHCRCELKASSVSEPKCPKCGQAIDAVTFEAIQKEAANDPNAGTVEFDAPVASKNNDSSASDSFGTVIPDSRQLASTAAQDPNAGTVEFDAPVASKNNDSSASDSFGTVIPDSRQLASMPAQDPNAGTVEFDVPVASKNNDSSASDSFGTVIPDSRQLASIAEQDPNAGTVEFDVPVASKNNDSSASDSFGTVIPDSNQLASMAAQDPNSGTVEFDAPPPAPRNTDSTFGTIEVSQPQKGVEPSSPLASPSELTPPSRKITFGSNVTPPDALAQTFESDEFGTTPISVDPAAELTSQEPQGTGSELLSGTIDLGILPKLNDVGGATVDFEPNSTGSKSDILSATFELPSAGGSSKTLDAAERDVGSKTENANIGMTIQADRWTPSKEEIAEALAEGVQNTVDISFLGSLAASKLVDPLATKFDSATVDSNDEFGTGSKSAGSLTLESGSLSSASASNLLKSGGVHPGGASGSGSGSESGPPQGSKGSGSGPQVRAGGSGSGSAGPNAPPIKPGSGAPPKPRAPGHRSMASDAAEAAISQSLEQSLVIQPRVLRPEQPTPAHERIDYNLLKKLGEGGMGIVYAARQQSIRRVVALKMLKTRSGSKSNRDKEASQREKFLAEAVITGDLEHPNIVPIYDLGRDETGAIFYAMKHVKGTPWDKLIKDKSLHENLEVLMKISDAVAFAHSKFVIHRDLKPENVMLGDFGEVLLMDWGLAISIAVPPTNVAMGGTPAYMAPEMATGPLESLGVTSDVYLLGAILYEIVTGSRPHVGSSVTRCLMSAAKNDIVPTNKTGELVDIARKAMATRPEDRYASVRELQNAIRDYQSHTESIALGTRAQDDLTEALQTNRYESYARALFGFQEAVALWDGNTRAKSGISEAALAYAKCAQQKEDFDLGLSLLNPKDPQHTDLIEQLRASQHERNQRLNRLRTARRVGMALVASIFVIVTGAFFWIRAEARRAREAEAVAVDERKQAVVAKVQAEKAKEEEEKQRLAAVEARELAEKKRMEAEAAKLEEERQRKAAVAAQAAEKEQRTIADKKRVEAEMARAAEEEQRRLAVLAREQEEYEGYVAKIGLAAAKIDENAFDHALSLIQECPEHLRHWEWGRIKFLCTRELKSYETPSPIETIALSSDGKQFATGGWGSKVYLFNTSDNQPKQTIDTKAEYVFSVAFSPDGKQLAVGSNRQPEFLDIYDATTGEKQLSLTGHSDAVLSIVWSRDGKQLLTGSYDNTARLWNIEKKTSQMFQGHDWWVWSAQFSPDESRIVTASQDGSAMVWDVKTREPSAPFLGHAGPVYAATFSPDGKTIATAGYDKKIFIWNPSDLETIDIAKSISESTENSTTEARMLTGHTAPIRSLQFSHHGKLLVSGSYDNAVGVWDVESGTQVKQLRGHANRVAAVSFAPDDEHVFSAGYDHSIKLWSISKYEEVRVLGGRVLKGHRDSILGAAFSPDGKQVVTASRDRSAIAWDVNSGESLRAYNEGHAYLASTAHFFPDGKHVLTAAVDNTARIWDLTTGTQVTTLEGTGIHAAVAIATSGSWIATGSDQKSIIIWNPDGKKVRELSGFKSDVTAIAISSDEQQLLVGDSTGRCQLVDVASGKASWESRSHSRSITSVAFVPKQSLVLTASADNTVAVRDLASGTEDAKRVLKHPRSVNAMSVSSDGNKVVTACTDKIVRVWNLKDGQSVLSTPESEVATTDVGFTPDDAKAFVVTSDNRIHLWDLNSKQELKGKDDSQKAFLDLSKTTVLIWGAEFSNSGEQLLTVGGAEAHLWDANNAKQLMSFSPQSAVSSVQFSQNGNKLVTGSWDNAARIWNASTGTALIKLGGVHTRFVNASTFSPDGTRVLTASDDHTACLWDVESGRLLGKYEGHTGRVTDVAFSKDGSRVLTASDDHTARIWETDTFKLIHELKGHTQAVLCAKFSSDGLQVITGSDDTTARLWDATTGRAQSVVLAGHTASVTAVAFTPDGRRVLTGSKDISAKLWDPVTGKEVLTLTGHTQEITTVAVSPDGSSVLTGSRDGTAIVWLTTPWS